MELVGFVYCLAYADNMLCIRITHWLRYFDWLTTYAHTENIHRTETWFSHQLALYYLLGTHTHTWRGNVKADTGGRPHLTRCLIVDTDTGPDGSRRDTLDDRMTDGRVYIGLNDVGRCECVYENHLRPCHVDPMCPRAICVTGTPQQCNPYVNFNKTLKCNILKWCYLNWPVAKLVTICVKKILLT